MNAIRQINSKRSYEKTHRDPGDYQRVVSSTFDRNDLQDQASSIAIALLAERKRAKQSRPVTIRKFSFQD